MTKRKGLPDSYFLTYRGKEGNYLKYGEHWNSNVVDDTDVGLINAISRVFSKYNMQPPNFNSLLDVGCANGGKLQKFHDNYGLEVFGIDNAEWARKNIIPGYENHIIFGDCMEHLPSFRDNSYDVVLETAGKYLEPEAVKSCIEHCSRIANKIVVSTIATTDLPLWSDNAPKGLYNIEITPDDECQTIIKTTDWWIKMYQSVNDYNFIDVDGFYLIASIDNSEKLK